MIVQLIFWRALIAYSYNPLKGNRRFTQKIRHLFLSFLKESQIRANQRAQFLLRF
jgi:hypothetical protein